MKKLKAKIEGKEFPDDGDSSDKGKGGKRKSSTDSSTSDSGKDKNGKKKKKDEKSKSKDPKSGGLSILRKMKLFILRHTLCRKILCCCTDTNEQDTKDIKRIEQDEE